MVDGKYYTILLTICSLSNGVRVMIIGLRFVEIKNMSLSDVSYRNAAHFATNSNFFNFPR